MQLCNGCKHLTSVVVVHRAKYEGENIVGYNIEMLPKDKATEEEWNNGSKFYECAKLKKLIAGLELVPVPLTEKCYERLVDAKVTSEIWLVISHAIIGGDYTVYAFDNEAAADRCCEDMSTASINKVLKIKVANKTSLKVYNDWDPKQVKGEAIDIPTIAVPNNPRPEPLPIPRPWEKRRTQPYPYDNEPSVPWDERRSWPDPRIDKPEDWPQPPKIFFLTTNRPGNIEELINQGILKDRKVFKVNIDR